MPINKNFLQDIKQKRLTIPELILIEYLNNINTTEWYNDCFLYTYKDMRLFLYNPNGLLLIDYDNVFSNISLHFKNYSKGYIDEILNLVKKYVTKKLGLNIVKIKITTDYYS